MTIPSALVAVCIGLLLTSVKQRRDMEQDLTSQVQSKQTRIGELEQDLQELSAKLDKLVRGSLPDPLHVLSFDDMIPLEQDGLRSVLFTRVGTADRPAYQYHLVVENETSTPVHPQWRLLLFDKSGIQIGAADLADSDDWQKLGGSGLSPGEKRNFAGSMRLQFDADPAYFFILPLPSDDSLPALVP